MNPGLPCHLSQAFLRLSASGPRYIQGTKEAKRDALAPSEDARTPALLPLTLQVSPHHQCQGKESECRVLARADHELAGFEGGDGEQESVGDCFTSPGSVSNIPEVARTQLSLLRHPCVIGVAEVGCLKAKIALGPACMQISGKKRAVFSETGAWVSPLLPCSAFSILCELAALAPESKSRPLWVRSRAYLAPYFVSRHHASTFIHAL